jgi:hypothetical protein
VTELALPGRCAVVAAIDCQVIEDPAGTDTCGDELWLSVACEASKTSAENSLDQYTGREAIKQAGMDCDPRGVGDHLTPWETEIGVML